MILSDYKQVLKNLPFFLLFLIYSLLTYPSIYFWDSGEFSFISTFLGTPHPTGYPLYIQLLRLFSALPLGSPYYLQNLFSAVWATFSVFLLYKLCYQITKHYPSSLVAALFFALSPNVVSKATMAEVYTLQIFIVISVTFLGYSLLNTWDIRKAWMIAFLLGLGITNHMTTIFLLPGSLYLLYTAPKGTRDAKLYFGLLLFGIIGLFPYVFILFRNHLTTPQFFPKWFGINMSSLSDWYWLVSGRLHRVDMTTFSLLRYLKELGFFGYLLFRDFYWVGGIVGLLGLVRFFSVHSRAAIYISLTFLSHLLFFIHYNIPDIHDYYTILFSFWSIWLAIGLQNLDLFIKSQTPSMPANWFRFGMVCLLTLPLVGIFQSHKPFRFEMTPLAYTHQVLSNPQKIGLFITSYTTTNTFWFFQQLTPVRPDIEIFDQIIVSLRERSRLAKLRSPTDEQFSFRVKQNFKEIIENKIIQQMKQHPVFIDRDEGFLHEKFRRTKLFDGFFQVALKSPPHVTDIKPDNLMKPPVIFNSSLQLIGYSITPSPLVEGEMYQFTLFWRLNGLLPKEVGGILRFNKKEKSHFNRGDEGFYLEFTLGSGLLDPSEWPQQKLIKESFQSNIKTVYPGRHEISLLLFNKETFKPLPMAGFSNITNKTIFFPIGDIRIENSPSIQHFWDKN